MGWFKDIWNSIGKKYAEEQVMDAALFAIKAAILFPALVQAKPGRVARAALVYVATHGAPTDAAVREALKDI